MICTECLNNISHSVTDNNKNYMNNKGCDVQCELYALNMIETVKENS